MSDKLPAKYHERWFVEYYNDNTGVVPRTFKLMFNPNTNEYERWYGDSDSLLNRANYMATWKEFYVEYLLNHHTIMQLADSPDKLRSLSKSIANNTVYGYIKGRSEKINESCDHEWVNVGFTTETIVCKHCDKEQK